MTKLSLLAALFVLGACSAPPALDPIARTRAAVEPERAVPLVGPAFGVDAPIPHTGNGNEGFPSVACDGAGTCLVVWADDDGITGTRFRADGTVLEPRGMSIALGVDATPVVSFGRESFLVMWATEAGAVARRVAVDGSVLDASDIVLTSEAALPSVASDGEDWLLAWIRATNVYGAYDVVAERLSSSGEVLDPNGFLVSAGSANAGTPAVSPGGAGYLVAWASTAVPGAILGARITSAGSVLDTPGLRVAPTSRSAGSVTAAYDGANWLVAYAEVSPLSIWVDDLRATRVTPDGGVLDATPISIASNRQLVTVTFDGADWLLAWDDFVGCYAGRVSSNGTLLDGAGYSMTPRVSDAALPGIAFNGTDTVFVWNSRSDDPLGPLNYAKRIGPGFNVRDQQGIRLGHNDNDESLPSVASNGSEYLVAWVDNRNGEPDFYASRVSEDGVSLDTSAIPVALQPDNNDTPHVASDGTNFLVTWSYSDIVWGTLIAADGSVLAAEKRLGFGTPGGAIAFGAGEWFLVNIVNNGVDGSRIWGVRVDRSGEPLDSYPFPVIEPVSWSHFMEQPSLTFDGTNFVLGWVDYRADSGPNVYARLVSPSGEALGSADIPVLTGQMGPPRLSAGTSATLVASVKSSTAIVLARLDGSGQVLDPGGVFVPDALPADSPVLSRFGSDWLVTWPARGSSTGLDLLAQRVAADATSVGSPFVLANGMDNEDQPSVALGSRASLLTYRFRKNQETRTKARLIVNCDGQASCALPSGGSGGTAGSDDAGGAAGGPGDAGGTTGNGGTATGGTGGTVSPGEAGAFSSGGATAGGGRGTGGGSEPQAGADSEPGRGEAGDAGDGAGGSAAAHGGRGGASGSGTSGRGGTAGRSTGGASAAGAGGAPDDGSGCGCRTPSSRRSGGSVSLLALVAAGVFARRRRYARIRRHSLTNRFRCGSAQRVLRRTRAARSRRARGARPPRACAGSR